MNFQNDKQILLVIRYSLLIFIIFISSIITMFLYLENKSVFEKMEKQIEEKFILDRKELIKEQVDNVYNYIISEQEETENNLKESLMNRVYEAHNLIINIYNQHKDLDTKEELTKLINSAIKSLRFNNNRGYFFVYDKNAVNVIHPLIPSLEGKSLINHQDTKGTYVLKESLSLLKNNDESYQEWYWKKSKTDIKEYKKIGFLKNIYELDWFIGTGEYVEDFSQDIQKKVLKQINKFRFGNNSYFIVTDKNNNYISHINKDLIGKNSLKEIKNVSDKNNIKQIEKVIKEKEGFINLEFYKPNSNIPVFKILYLKYIPNWDWVISTGFYKEDIDSLIKKEKEILINSYEENLKNLYVFSSMATLFLLILFFYLSYIIEKKFKIYKENIQNHIDKNQKQHELLTQKSKLAAMGEMIENIAHQWRQPLSMITTVSSGIKLQKEMNIMNDENLIKSIDSIINSTKYLSDTIDDFRDFFKPDKEKTFFDIRNSIKKSFKLLSSQIKNEDIKIIENSYEINIEGYERELLQVLLNIFKNSIDALEMKKDDKYIFIDIFKEDDNIFIKIKDNAGGVKEEIIGRIFEPYFTTKHQSQGTGIGLYMSEEIITKHMLGELSVENVSYEFENKIFNGAMFIIKLPINT